MEITFKGQAVELSGTPPKVGDKAPNFILKDLNDQPHSLEEMQGKPVILSVIPDIDTRVCALQTKRFNQEASQVSDVYFATISNNTKEEQANWCAKEGADMLMLHDPENKFGESYHLYIPKRDHFARAIFALDQEGTIRYEEIVSEISHEPDYEEALKQVRSLLA
ncbi:MAG TPA: thiol peroxidase [Candidatus Tetragenococcus pullicola]|nr:thiol peroxidase [Candidatus Tetragenococcus pullicola]